MIPLYARAERNREVTELALAKYLKLQSQREVAENPSMNDCGSEFNKRAGGLEQAFFFFNNKWDRALCMLQKTFWCCMTLLALI